MHSAHTPLTDMHKSHASMSHVHGGYVCTFLHLMCSSCILVLFFFWSMKSACLVVFFYMKMQHFGFLFISICLFPKLYYWCDILFDNTIYLYSNTKIALVCLFSIISNEGSNIFSSMLIRIWVIFFRCMSRYPCF